MTWVAFDRAIRIQAKRGLPADTRLRRLIDAFVHTILDELHGTALFLDLEALSPGCDFDPTASGFKGMTVPS